MRLVEVLRLGRLLLLRRLLCLGRWGPQLGQSQLLLRELR